MNAAEVVTVVVGEFSLCFFFLSSPLPHQKRRAEESRADFLEGRGEEDLKFLSHQKKKMLTLLQTPPRGAAAAVAPSP